MAFITFIYRIGNTKTYYGKYVCDYISDDHEGLDKEIKPTLVDGINKYRKQKGLSKLKTPVHIGILSFSANRDIPTYSTDAEIKCFGFYHSSYHNKSKTYVNGKLIT
jgi:hypothetical protein